jgi:hypothetical protein
MGDRSAAPRAQPGMELTKPPGVPKQRSFPPTAEHYSHSYLLLLGAGPP